MSIQRNEEKEEAFLKILELSGEVASKEELEIRSQIISYLEQLLIKWVQSVLTRHNVDKETVERARGIICPYGSYALGVSSVSSDIDLTMHRLCVVPGAVTEEDFFSSFYSILSSESRITNLIAIPVTFVPIITMEVDSVSVDLSLASLPVYPFLLPDSLDLLSDSLLQGVSEHTLLSLSGCRCTTYIQHHVIDQTIFRNTFLGVRFLLKQHYCYRNVMGYMGGINIAILVMALNSLTNDLLHNLFQFFHTYSTTLGTETIQLTPVIHHPELGYDHHIWSPVGKNQFDRLVVLTPTYPSINSMHATTKAPLQYMRSQFGIIANNLDQYRNNECSLLQVVSPVQFFDEYPYFVEIRISADSYNGFVDWSGWIESKIRLFAYFISKRFNEVVLNPNPIKTDEENTCYYYIGFIPDIFETRINMSQCANDFIDIARIKQTTGKYLQLKFKKRKDLTYLNPSIPEAWRDIETTEEFKDIFVHSSSF